MERGSDKDPPPIHDSPSMPLPELDSDVSLEGARVASDRPEESRLGMRESGPGQGRSGANHPPDRGWPGSGSSASHCHTGTA